jgi:anti-sigma regulatory factor (Ser/Thr protein kinase)
VPATTITYPGTPASVPSVRRFVRRLLADTTRVDDLELIAAELATNAIRHTPSGQEGGRYTVTVRHLAGRARLEVADQGTGPWLRLAAGGGNCGGGNCGGGAECGRGLSIVTALADEIGLCVQADGWNVLWAEITC